MMSSCEATTDIRGSPPTSQFGGIALFYPSCGRVVRRLATHAEVPGSISGLSAIFSLDVKG